LLLTLLEKRNPGVAVDAGERERREKKKGFNFRELAAVPGRLVLLTFLI
jgi:hypothetical protein